MSMYGNDPTSLDLTIPPEEERRMKAAQVWVRRFRWATWLFLLLMAGAALWWGSANS